MPKLVQLREQKTEFTNFIKQCLQNITNLQIFTEHVFFGCTRTKIVETLCKTIRVNGTKNCVHINVLTDKYNFETKATFVFNHKNKPIYSLCKFQLIK